MDQNNLKSAIKLYRVFKKKNANPKNIHKLGLLLKQYEKEFYTKMER